MVRGNLCKCSVDRESMTILKLYLQLHGYIVCFLYVDILMLNFQAAGYQR